MNINYFEFCKLKNKLFFVYKQNNDFERFYYVKQGRFIKVYKMIVSKRPCSIPQVELIDTMSLRNIQLENDVWCTIFFYDNRPIVGVYYNFEKLSISCN